MRSTITRSRVAAAAVALSMAAAGAVGLAATSEAAAATYTVSPKTGPGGDNNAGGTSGQPASAAKVVTINGSKFRSATNVALADGVKWATTVAGCAAGTTVSTFSVPTATQVVATIPANELALTAKVTGGVTTFVKKDYVLCVFDGGTLLGTGKYSVYPTPTVTAVAPASGAVSGGSTVTVEGTGFTSTSVVKFGSVAATQVKVATDGASLTAKVPAGAAAGAVDISVTTEGGATANTVNDNYTYVNAISVSPSTSSADDATLTVKGVGFAAMDFSTVNTRVFLIQGAFAAGAHGATETCGAVQVVSDTQLVCTLDGTLADGSYTVYVVADKTAGPASAISSSATFTSAAF
jgi:hypothetical protein